MIEKVPSLGDVSRARGRTSGFDYLRIGLAISVVVFHTALICYGPRFEQTLWESWVRVLCFFRLPVFFTLSGFLVAASLERNPGVASFVTLRALRIYPAFFAETLISAAVLGPLITSTSLWFYVSDPLFGAYFAHLVGFSSPELPAVFMGNPLPLEMNRALWTIPFELLCYAILVACAAIGLLRRPILLFVLVAGALIAFPIGKLLKTGGLEFDTPSGRLLIICFVMGMAIHAWRNSIPYSRKLFWFSLVAYAGLSYFMQTSWLAVVPAAYVAIYVGLQDPPRLFFVRGRDYAYGLYLFAFPIQQLVASLLADRLVWWLHILISLPIAMLAAVASWHFIEAPVMSRRKAAVAWVSKIIRPRSLDGVTYPTEQSTAPVAAVAKSRH